MSACKEVFGSKKYHHKDWISAETLSKSRVRKEKTAANKNTKKSIRADEGRYINGLAEAADPAAGVENMKGRYDTTKKLTGKFRKKDQ